MDINLPKEDKAPLASDVPSSPYRIGLLLIDGFALMSYACISEPLRAANLLVGRELYQVTNIVPGLGVHSSGAAQIGQSALIGEEGPLDLLLVVAGGDPFEFVDPQLFAWLRALDASAVRIGGVSGGPVILARAGLLDARRITVHWEHAAMLSEAYPDLLLERRLYVIDRDRVTCGGGIAPLDLMHALIASHHGSSFARLVSDWFLHTEIRAAASPQRGGLAERIGSQSPVILEAVTAMESHIADPLTLKQLALIADVSPRHLNRLFRAELSESTMDFYRMLRLDVGRRLIRRSSLRIAEIAETTGFTSAAHFSNAYLAQFGERPSMERRRD